MVNEKEMHEHVKSHKKEVGEELSDVLYWVLLMSYDLGININQALKNKIKSSENKYPVKKSKGKNKKYTEL